MTTKALIRPPAANLTTVQNIYQNSFPLTRTGTAVTSTTQTKFSAASLYSIGGTNAWYLPAGTIGTNISGDFTFAMWVYLPTAAGSGEKSLLTAWYGGNTNFFMGVDPSGTFSFYRNNNFTFKGGVVPINQWVFLAVSRVGNQLSLYINSNRVYLATTSENIPISNNAIGVGSQQIDGGTSSGAGGFPNGIYYDNLMILNGVGLYTGPVISVPTEPFTGETISGIVTENGIPVARNITVLYGDPISKIVTSTTSNASTGEYAVYVVEAGSYTVLCQDPVRPSKILDKIVIL